MFIDLHCHYLPAIDDGVKTAEEGVALCLGLRRIGFGTVMATPHIRTAMFDNRAPGLREAWQSFADSYAADEGMPELGLGAEHYFDDTFWSLFQAGQAVPYPGGHAALVELPRDRLPLRLEHCFFEMKVKKVRPVLAHPERYRPFFKKTDAMDPLLRAGATPLLDLMSLTGRYGRSPRKAAERMLDEGVYFAACSDAHRPKDVALVEQAIQKLRKRVGETEAQALLEENPRRILAGAADLV